MQNRFTEIQDEFRQIKELLEKDSNINQKEFVLDKFNNLNEICLDSQKVLIQESINTYKWSFKIKYIQKKLMEIIDPYDLESSKSNFILKFIQYLNFDQSCCSELNQKFQEYLKTSPPNHMERECEIFYNRELDMLKKETVQNDLNQKFLSTDSFLTGNCDNTQNYTKTDECLQYKNLQTFHNLETVKGAENSNALLYQNLTNFDGIDRADFGILSEPFNIETTSTNMDHDAICNLDQNDQNLFSTNQEINSLF